MDDSISAQWTQWQAVARPTNVPQPVRRKRWRRSRVPYIQRQRQRRLLDNTVRGYDEGRSGHVGVGWLSIHILDKAAHSFSMPRSISIQSIQSIQFNSIQFNSMPRSISTADSDVDTRTAAGDGLTLHTSSVVMARENLVLHRIWLEGPAGLTLQLRVSTNVHTAWVPAQLTPWSQRSHPERQGPLPSW